MPPKKNVGGPKGKGPAKKTSAKRPPPPLDTSSEEEGVSAEDLDALIARMDKFERERGLQTRDAGPRPARRASRKLIFKNLLSRMSSLESGRGVVRPEGEQAEQAESRQRRDGSPAPTVIQPPEGDERGTGADSAVTTAPGPALVPTQAQISVAEPQPENEASTAICRPTEAGVPARLTTTVIPETPGSSQTSIQRGALDGPSTSSDGAVQTVGTRRGRSAGADARPSLEGWNDEAALGNVGLAHRRRVLVCGHSFVFWAEREALKTAYGQHLGLSSIATIEWRGVRGLRWYGLCPLLFRARSGPPPDVLVIHLGGNDLGLLTGKALFLQARADIKKIWRAWPEVHIAWSAIIPRRKWLGGGDVRKLEKARKRVNRAMRMFMIRQRGYYIEHTDITREQQGFYRVDGVHLSETGNQQFLADLRQGIQGVLGELVGDGGEIDICPQSVALNS
ncbi:uncharacterized protein [Anolis sagrei]|uniref:uncharacterized protein isoform X3 n=1 Tax=Anolis sagrei TaxID=38937 RepID=UPI0035224097